MFASLKHLYSLLKRVSDEGDRDDADIVAAGLAFYGFLGLFPALIALVSLFGIVADPRHIQQTIWTVARTLPGAAQELVASELSKFIARPAQSLSIGVILGFFGVLWSASSAMSVLVRAVNVAYDIPSRRSFLRRRGRAVVMTLGGMLGMFVLVPVVAILPRVLAFLHVGGLLTWLRWPALGVGAWLTLVLLYRYSVERSVLPSVRSVLPGATTASLLWVGLCAIYSAYVRYFTSFSITYGALTGVIVLEFWLYVSSLIVVYGAELNSELERGTDAGLAASDGHAQKQLTPRDA